MSRWPRSPSLGPIETLIAAVVPRVGAERLAHRLRADNLRAYDAAARGRRTEGWRAASSSADAEIGAAGAILRNRMRDLVRNNPLAANAVSTLVSNIVGGGIFPRAISDNPATNRRAMEAWSQFSDRCDADGRTNFGGMTALAVREMIEGGDCFALRRRRPANWRGLSVPLQVQLVEADHLDEAKFADSAGVRIEGGIEYDADGARAGYWLFPDHPGSRGGFRARSRASVRHEADAVIHLFERQRVQNRGVPWGAPVIRSLRDIDDWQAAELTRKKSEACLVGVVLGDDDDGGPGLTARDAEAGGMAVVDSSGNTLERLEPGLIAYARNGRDIKFNTPGQTGGVYEWNRVQWHYIAAGFRIPYALLTGDLSQTNFSSSRVGLSEFRRLIEAMQWGLVIPVFCQRYWDWAMEAAWTAGLIDRPDIPVEWDPPGFQSVNPLQDAQADAVEVRSGFASLPQIIAKRGYDPRDVLREQAEYLAEADGYGLVLDTDPRKVTKGGNSQAVQAGPDGQGGS